ncbi:E3 SUMO-protein ligase PIAS4-like isoform X3 [Narcine bancroftii]|uniref:E3 SUMO-protein ligase PIAS4-like isoform X3 n=1 Tax=Narcine bancroftii TaxID=1343680 RepID=UPI0038317FF8
MSLTACSSFATKSPRGSPLRRRHPSPLNGRDRWRPRDRAAPPDWPVGGSGVILRGARHESRSQGRDRGNKNMAEQSAAKSMILGFRISELQALLRFAGRSKSGSKHELVSRALQLVRTNCSSEILKKIQDLHAQRNGATTNTQSQQLLPTPTFPLHSSEAALNARTSVPICHTGKDDTKSKVRLTKLPFYTILDDLMKPTELVPTNSERIQENQFTFTLTEKQRNQIIAGCSNNGVHSVQVQLRICHTNTEFIQEDQYPPYFSIKVNSRVCPFTSYFSSNKPGVEPKRPCRPIDVTPLLNLTTTRGANYLGIFWGHFAKRYSVVLYLVKQHRVAELLHKLKVNETRASEISRELIRKKLQLEPDNDVTTTGLRVSLMCSLGKMRLSVPCRGITCTHLQCFDAALYIQMNEKKPTWMCPVCDKPAPYELLFVDHLFLDILKECEDSTEVQFKDDGSWTPIKPDKQSQKNFGPKCSIVELEDSSSNQFSNPENGKSEVDIIDLTVDC